MLVPSLLTVALLAAACDSENSGGSELGAQSGLESRSLGSLTQAELTKLNQSLDTYVADATPIAYNCKVSGLSNAVQAKALGYTANTDLQTYCSNAQASCMDTHKPNSRSPMTMSDIENCNATVAELETCVKDDTKGMLETIDAMPDCSEIDGATLLSYTSKSAPTPVSCEQFDDVCPGII